jgi:Ca2+-transporting ATPase
MNSVYGRVKALVEKERSNTPLQDKLEELADFIGWLGVGAALLTFMALLSKWGYHRFMVTDLGWEWSEAKNIVDMVITAITIVAMAVPEGLPLAVTISLAYSMIKMTKDQNLVRHLVACETMGGATQICSDKTGTLTQNKMTVTDCLIGNTRYNIDETKVDQFANQLLLKSSKLFTDNVAINSSANVLEQDGERVVSGSASEIALIEFIIKMQIDVTKVRKEESAKIIRNFAFSSTKKRMSTLISDTKKGSAILYVKGASEVVLELCKFEVVNGKEVNLTANRKAEILQQIENWAKNGLRTLTLAQKKVVLANVEHGTCEDGSLDHTLTLAAIVGIKDPVREEVPQAVRDCQKAGITVRMLTGDNILTASDIARQCNILTEKGIAIEGPEFRKMTDSEINKILPNLQVIARCSPEDKLKMVKLLRANEEVVAVTGDGTNDAPQLNEADVGFAMGIAGTEVAKQASDIILLDDNFNSILKAVLWGRNVFLSIKKFIQFQLTVNICAVFMGLLGAITNGETPLNAVQLLWVNLIMDTFAALALATDPPTKRLLDSPPYGRHASLITRKMWISILGQVVFQLSALIFLLFSDLTLIPFLEVTPATLEAVRASLIFNVFVFCQLFNEFNCRKIETDESVFTGMFSNQIFVGIMAFSVLVQALLIQYGDAFVHTIPLNGNQWIFCIVLASFSIPIGAILRMLPIAPEFTRHPTQKGFQKVAKQVLSHEADVKKVDSIGHTLHGSKKF